nr:MAG TPA: hypothetical protein [Caudoviricetes sp.]DAT54975.1 MAG TPA: hypothetical protein [Caudoviricetes sp.]
MIGRWLFPDRKSSFFISTWCNFSALLLVFGCSYRVYLPPKIL